MTRRRAGSQQAGFTLVETLVCLVLLGFIGSLMMSSHQMVIGAWRRLDARAEAGRSVVAAQEILRDRLSRLYPAVTGDTDAHVYVFDGTAARLTFIGPLSERTGTSALGRYSLDVWDGALHLSAALDGADRTDDNTVLGDLASLELSYFGQDDAAEPGYWHEQWRQRDTLPELIRVRLTRGAAADPRWPDLVIEPKITSGARCSLIKADKRCHAP